MKTKVNSSKKTVKSDYNYIEKNIYKTENTYRVRVCGKSACATSLSGARKLKRLMKANSQPVI